METGIVPQTVPPDADSALPIRSKKRAVGTIRIDHSPVEGNLPPALADQAGRRDSFLTPSSDSPRCDSRLDWSGDSRSIHHE